MKLFLCILCLLWALGLPVSALEPELKLTGPEIIYNKDKFSLQLALEGQALTQVAFTLTYDAEHLLFYGFDSTEDTPWEIADAGNRFTLTYTGEGEDSALPDLRFKLNSVPEGTAFWVLLSDIRMISADTEHTVSDIRWDKTVDQPPRTENRLASLGISHGALTPAFSPEVTAYTAVVPYHIGAVEVTATAQDAYAKIEINDPPLTPDGTTQITVTVTAQNGNARVYTVAVTREKDPNRLPSSECALAGIDVKDFWLSPAFQPELTEYVLWLPYEASRVDISGVPKDPRATVTVEGNKELLPGFDNPITLTCTAEDGTRRVYTVMAKRAAPPTVATTLPAQTTQITQPDVYTTAPISPETTHPAPTQTTQQAPTEPTYDPEIPSWSYVVMAVAGITGAAALGILISDRKK